LAARLLRPFLRRSSPAIVSRQPTVAGDILGGHAARVSVRSLLGGLPLAPADWLVAVVHEGHAGHAEATRVGDAVGLDEHDWIQLPSLPRGGSAPK
jgi:hypothetical protein